MYLLVDMLWTYKYLSLVKGYLLADNLWSSLRNKEDLFCLTGVVKPGV
jgi:hypothetical protein